MSLEGQQLDRYRLQQALAVGSMARVYLAADTLIHRQVAIKLCALDESSRLPSEARTAFLRQIEAIARLKHPAIVPLFGYGETDLNAMRYFYIAMPFFPEGTLGQWWRQQRRTNAGPFARPDPLLPQEVADVVQQAASALQYAHDRQIIHQHLHASNLLVRSKQASSHLPDLLLTDFVDVVIANFRIAKVASAYPFGISPFIAPEQLQGTPRPASDQYALASLAYQLLTGFPPFRGEVLTVVFQILHDQPQPPSTLQPRLPPDSIRCC